ncbi:hypothetical protein MKX03_037457 [Papaver bracteatum]|nr:hypothetical protein MKX03_037457 [Papaver bracteatum]
MMSVWPNSLILTAVYGVVEAASIALFGPIVGQLVDNLTYVQVYLIHTGLAVCVSLIVLTNVFGVLATLAGTILVDKEWVIVIAKGEPPKVLSNMNSVIRRIDLSCKLFAPVASGFIISFISVEASAVSLALWNVISVWLQYWLLKSDQVERSLSMSTDTKVLVSHLGNTSPFKVYSWRQNIKRLSKATFLDAWIVYLQQDVLLLGLAVCLLYYNIPR